MYVGPEESVESTEVAEICIGYIGDIILGELQEAEPIAEGVLLAQLEEEDCPCTGCVGRDELVAKLLGGLARLRLRDAHLDDLLQHGGRLRLDLLREESSSKFRFLLLLPLFLLVRLLLLLSRLSRSSRRRNLLLLIIVATSWRRLLRIVRLDWQKRKVN